MKTLHISVSDKIATYCQRDGDIVCGNNDYQIEFAFDSEWEPYSNKTARFIVYRSGSKPWGFEDVEFTGTICPVPIFTNAQKVEVGVYAGELCTTTPATIGCKKSILCPDVKPTEAYDGRYASEAKAAAESAEAAAVRAEAAAEMAAEDAVKAAEDAIDKAIEDSIDASKYENAVKANVSGTSLQIDDLSPLTSKLKVTVAETGEVTPLALTAGGDELVNIVPYPYMDGMELTKNGITFLVNEDGSIKVSGKATAVTAFTIYDEKSSIAPFEAGKFYTKNKQNYDGVYFYSQYYELTDGSYSFFTFCPGDNASTQIPDTAVGVKLYVAVSKDVDLSTGVTVYPMIVEGKSVSITEYVPPQSVPCKCVDTDGDGLCDRCGQPIVTIKTASADDPDTVVETVATQPGATVELTPIFPSMIITTDRDDVILSAEYNRDTNKVIEELRKEIGEGGGGSDADLSNYYNKQEIDAMIGDIDTALEELHTYAQNLSNGGSTE